MKRESGVVALSFILSCLVARAELSALSYISNGLVGHWDGIENVSYGGAHDSSATKWTDLTGNNLNFSVPAGGAFTETGLTTVRKSGAQIANTTWIASAAYKAFAAKAYTVEFAYNQLAKTVEGTSGRSATIPLGYQNQGVLMLLGADKYWIGTLNNKTVGFTTRRGWEGGLRVSASASSILGAHTLSCSQEGSSCAVVLDGTRTMSTQSPDATITTGHSLCLNRKGYYNISNGLDCCYHSVRFYDRKLSVDEVAVNRAVDLVRYFGADASSLTLPDGWKFETDGGEVSLFRRLAVTVKNGLGVAGVGGTVSVDGASAALAGSVWCEQGKTVPVTLSATPDEGYVFVGWEGVPEAVRHEAETEADVSTDVVAIFRKTDGSEPFSYVWSGASGGIWDDTTSWTDAAGCLGVPVAGDSVTVPKGITLTRTNSTVALGAVTVAGTLVMTNWTTCLKATTVTVPSGGTITCGAAVTDMDDMSRVWISCTNLTVAAGGAINVTKKGYASLPPTSGSYRLGFGPGRSSVLYHQGPSHGGCGARRLNRSSAAFPPLPYDDPSDPLLPGSSGTATSWGRTGFGGGAILVEATGDVVVDGTVSANGGSNSSALSSGSSNHDCAGSGGSVNIRCRTFSGTGTVSAEGGDGDNVAQTYSGMAGGGGMIAVRYDAEAQKEMSVAGMTITAAGGLHYEGGVVTAVNSDKSRQNADLGTLWFTDARIVDELLGNGLAGQIRNLTAYTRTGGLDMTYGHVRFAEEGVQVEIGGDVEIGGRGTRLEIGGTTPTNHTAYTELHCGTTPSRLSVAGDLRLSGVSRLDIRAAATNGVDTFGAIVEVAGTMTVESNCYVYAWSDARNLGSPKFDVGNLVVATGAVVSASRRGGAGAYWQNFGIDGSESGFGPGKGVWRGNTYYCGGGGHGGKGGLSTGGAAYGDPLRPTSAGSGGGGNYDSKGYSIGGYGGGLVYFRATNGLIRVDGKITADGETGTASWIYGGNTYGGGGSGGAVLLESRTFVMGETGVISVKGGASKPAETVKAGAGGGGRIAIWCGEPWRADAQGGTVRKSATPFAADVCPEFFSCAGTFSVAAGTPTGSYVTSACYGGDGTVRFCYATKAAALTLIVR